MHLSMLAPTPLQGEVRQSRGFDLIRIQLPHPPVKILIQIPPSESSPIDGSGVVNAGHDTVVIADGDKKNSPYVFNKIAKVEDQHRSEEHAYRRSNRLLEYRHCAMRARLACHGTALYCTPHTRTIRIAHAHFSDSISRPWDKSAIPNKENSLPCLWWRWGLTLIYRCII